MSGKCYWWTGHEWGQWQLLSIPMINFIYDKKFTETVQRRRCERCGKYQERPV